MDASESSPLAGARVVPRLPARDLDRARSFYARVLGLRPAEERPGGMLYRCGGAEFVVFRSAGTGEERHGAFTQMAWEVDDIEAATAWLRARGAVFEDVELPAALGGGRTRDGIIEVEGNYPSTGARGARGAWFRDSEGNLLSLEAPVG